MGILRRRTATTHSAEGKRTARGRYPDSDVAAWIAYVAKGSPEVEVLDHGPLVVGQRRAWPRDKDIDVIPKLIVHRSPEGTTRWWPARLFAVGSMEGLERRSFAGVGSSSMGWCRAYTILEELPGHRSYGPGGETAVGIAEHAARLEAPDIRRLGELARSVVPKPPLEAIRAAHLARYGPDVWWPVPRDTDRSPSSSTTPGRRKRSSSTRRSARGTSSTSSMDACGSG